MSYINLSYIRNIDDIKNLSPVDFEYFCADLVSSAWDCNCQVTKYKKDGGVDIIATRNGEDVYIQCKRWYDKGKKGKKNVSVDEIRRFHSVIVSNSISKGVFIALVPYTRDAKILAKKSNIILYGIDEIERLVQGANNEYECEQLRLGAKSKRTGEFIEFADQGAIDNIDEILEESLRELRRVISIREDVPAYFVFTNVQLADIIKKRPRNLVDLRSVYGFAEKRIEKYGEAIIDTINEQLHEFRA